LAETRWKGPVLLCAVLSQFALAGCSQTGTDSMSVSSIGGSPSLKTRTYGYSSRDRECLERAMYFESSRSSRAGMIAVGTVVMNRLRSGKHGNSICEVVGERGQFAPGVLTRKMDSRAMPLVSEAAAAVLRGERASKLKNAMHFHTAGLKFPYKNMHYVLVAGGNAFYEKRTRNWKPLPDEPMVTHAGRKKKAAPQERSPAVMASAGTASEPDSQADGKEMRLPDAVPVPPPSRPAQVAAAEEPIAARFGQMDDTAHDDSDVPLGFAQ
jgi:hypothetical protein